MQHLRALAGVCVVCLLVFGASSARAQLAPPELPLLDQLEIIHLDRELLAVNASGGDARIRLELNERVVWTGSRGVTGAVVTDRRVLFVAAGRGAWQELRFLRDEAPATGAWIGQRVALAHTSRRVLGFSGLGGNIIEYRLGPNEHLTSVDVAEGIGVALTDRKALGFSSRLGGFFETPIGIRERIESVDARAEVATVLTNRRLLTFRGVGGVWGERRRELGGS